MLDAYPGQWEPDRGVARGVPFAPGGGKAASMPLKPDALLPGARTLLAPTWSSETEEEAEKHT